MTSLPDGAARSDRRPSGWWFVVGAAMVVAALVLAVVVIALAVRGFSHVEATVPADGHPVQVQVDPGTTYLVWDDADGPADRCTFVDATGASLPLQALGSARFNRSGGSGSWEGAGYLHPTTSPLTVTCDAVGGPVQIGRSPRLGAFVGGILVAVLVGLLLGGAGIAVLVTTGILFAVRGPRRS